MVTPKQVVLMLETEEHLTCKFLRASACTLAFSSAVNLSLFSIVLMKLKAWY